jgi:hypothetical protein|nr:MAG TPA: hypothetical protein [Caudoviricetes sp.]
MKVLKGIAQIVICFVVLSFAQPLIYRVATFIGDFFTSGMFVVVSFGVGLLVLYGFFSLFCYAISYGIGTKTSAIITSLLCIAQTIYFNAQLTIHNDFSAAIVASWIAIVLSVVGQASFLFLGVKMKEEQE